jgi:hypothetical protein
MADKDFFLSPDDAMTMGDINYMRKATRTRRTFPKTLKNKDGSAFDNEVSSIENRNNLYKGSNTNQNTTLNTVFIPTPSSQSQPGVTGGSAVTQTNPNALKDNTEQLASNFNVKPVETVPQQRRQADSSMDMFRNMAKTMRGKK